MSDVSWVLFIYGRSLKDRRFNSLAIKTRKECQADVLSNTDVTTFRYFTHGLVRFRLQGWHGDREKMFCWLMLFHYLLVYKISLLFLRIHHHYHHLLPYWKFNSWQSTVTVINPSRHHHYHHKHHPLMLARPSEGHVLFNHALNTFYIQLYGVRHG